MKTISLIFIFIFGWIEEYLCLFRRDSFTIFDKFYFNDIFSLYQKQLFTKQCTINDGPNCYQISSKDQYDQSPDVKEALNYFGNRIEIDSLSDYMSNVVRSFREEHKTLLQEVASQVISLNLLLTFESYDEVTRQGDIYMPEEKVIKFQVGFIKLSFIGKLKLRNLNEKHPDDKKGEKPQLTYGVIESNELLIKFDKPLTFNSIYIRAQEKMKPNTKITIVGYSKDDKELYRVTETMNYKGRKWIKVLGRESILVDYIKLPGEIEIDNLSVTSAKETDNLFNSNKIHKVIEKVINEFLSKSKNKSKDKDTTENKVEIKVINLDDL